MELRCEGAAAAVSATTNLKESLASLRWEAERIHEIWDFLAAHSILIGFQKQHKQHLELQSAGARGIWTCFNTGDPRHMLCQIA